MLESKRIGFIGGGAMGEALIRGMLKAGLVTAAQITDKRRGAGAP